MMLAVAVLAVAAAASTPANPWRGPNYDKSKIEPYTLEDPLVFADGRKVASADDWEERRREILGIFAREMYGVEPPPPEALEIEKFDERVSAAGFAIRRQYRMWFRKDRTGPCISWIVWTPRHAKGPVPAVLLLNYRGNHELTTEKDVPVQAGWVRNNKAHFVDDHRASEKTRGKLAATSAIDTFPLGTILARGYAAASACYCEVSPDPYWTEPPPYEQSKFPYTGVFELWGPRDESRDDNTTAIGAWAWALSRGLDLLSTVPGVDSNRVVVTGCSRLGKAALLAAARDVRFPVCAVNQAGGGGVCLAKRDYGENPSTETVQFSHWYCKAYKKYADDFPKSLTFDQHLLLASIAPRSVLVEGFDSSKWMDTEGEFLACRAAAPVWRFLGLGTMPDVPYPGNYDTSAIGECLGYVRRSEDHGISHQDWLWTLDFADKAWKRAAETPKFDASAGKGEREWENTSVNSISREPPRTYTVPLASEKEALSDALVHKTPYSISLNGRWKLSWAGNPSLRVKGFERPDFPDADWFGVDVPGCVELQGFGSPGYVNSRYPHKLDWPRILDCQTGQPDYNPVSSYRRKFTVPKEWKGREVFLRFDGVYSAYYVWVNGKMAGYAEDSCLPSEFRVTDLLEEGENVLAVEVYRWCDGSYLEDQDMTRYSGIYRDVSLWSMPKGGIWDFKVKTRPVDGYESWSLELELENGGSASLYDAENNKVGDLTPLSNSNFQLQLKPRLWSAEKPYLYTLVVRKVGDIRAKKVGFKEVKIVGNTILVNGRKVKFRGVNRHEASPEGGRTVTLGEMLADIELLKRHNFDTVRTSHYPDHHLWYELCDRYGIYLCAEANVEGHGAEYAEKGLGRFAAWRDSIVERNVRHVAFYRNHPSVTFWSLGNETGHGPCFTEAIAKVKEMDPSRPVHWERGNPDADVDSHMYRSVEWLEKRGQLGDMPRGSATEKGWPDENYMSSGKPFFMCEYAHAMGNAVGNFAEYWDVFWKYDSLVGGCVWDWADQAVWKYTGRVDENGSPERFLAYGGDWDEQPNDGPFNCNGIVGPERRISAKLLEAAHVQRSLVVRDDLTLENRYGFTWSDEFDGEWSLVEGGVETKKGAFDVPRVAPLSKGRIDLALPAPAKGREAFANISFRLKHDTPWAKKGWCVSRNQIRLSGAVPQAAAKAASPRITESADAVTAEHAGTRAVFSRRTGTLRELVVGGVTVLRDPAPGVAAGPRLTCSRAFVDNDIWVRGYTVDEPRSFMLSGLTQLSYHARPIVVADGKVRLSVEITGSKSAGFRHDSEWSFLDDGSLVVSNTVVPHGTMPRRLPRLGLSMRLDKSLERVRWYGRGPQENYIDRRTGAFFGVYESTVTDLYEPYTRPQDNGYRTDVRWVDFLADDGRGVRFSASEPLFVQALHYSEEDLDRSRHRNHEPRRMQPLVPSDETYLNLDIRQLGLGGASCGPTTMPKYTFPAQEERWTLRIEPARRTPKAEPPPAPRSAYDDLVPIPRGVRYTAGEVGVDALDRVDVRKTSIAGAPAHVADEAYRLTVGVGGVVVEAQGERGELYARTTLAQLRALAGGRPVPAAVVTDWPELRWRGFMPDTARNYLDVPSLKAVIDMMGRYKLNLLHWHLTENYAWRLESRRYPQMQSDEAFVLRHRGKFYTQDEFRDIVDYAYGRGVTVMPEFDVPGHAQALRLALGVDRMTAPGVAETVAGLFDELCSLVPAEKMPFIHVGGDEVWTRETEGVSPETLRLWAETIARNGRTLVSWNPGEKYPVAGPRVDMMWGGYGVKSSGAPIFDANGMYIEAMDPFEIICSAAFRRVNPWDVPAEQRLGAIFCAWHDGFTGLPYDNMLRNQQIMPACVMYGNAYWSGCLADRPDRTCRMPQPDDPDFARVVDLERRVVAQRDRVLSGLKHPFHFLRQSDLRWRISDGDGKLIAKDVPGATISPFKGRGSKCNFITNATGVVVMETWVRSPRDQEVGAWIGFTNIDRDHGLIRASPLPKLGEWTRFGSSIEINGIPVPPPEWNRPGLTRGRNLREVLKAWPWTLWELDEEPFTDQEYFMRPPTRIRLRKGWNHVKLTLPMTSPVTGWSSHQWVGTFIPVLGDSDHPREVPGLEYASER